MPIHDWSRTDSGIFHDLHLMWIAFLLPHRFVRLPLEDTYTEAFRSLPKKYRDVLEGAPSR